MVAPTVNSPMLSNAFEAGRKLFPSASTSSGLDSPNMRRPTGAVIEHVRRLMSSYKPIFERRGAPRFSVTFSARAVALDAKMQPAGGEISVVVRNISATGLGVYSKTPVGSPHLAIEMESDGGEKILVAIAVRRCRPIGCCFDIGGRFVVQEPAP
jgi:hypothetical protein